MRIRLSVVKRGLQCNIPLQRYSGKLHTLNSRKLNVLIFYRAISGKFKKDIEDEEDEEEEEEKKVFELEDNDKDDEDVFDKDEGMDGESDLPFYKRWANSVAQFNVTNVLNKEFIIDRVFGDFSIFRVNTRFKIRVEYEADALDNGLSYTKMLEEIEMRHPRDEKREKFHIWNSNTGSFFLPKKFRKTDFAELGTGVCLYFKMIKYMMGLFLLFTILSIPSYFLYWTGNNYRNRMYSTSSFMNLDYVLSANSIGNLGESLKSCFSMTVNKPSIQNQTLQLSCDYGVMTALN